MKNIKKILIALILTLTLSSCSYYPVDISYYRIDNPTDTVTVHLRGYASEPECIGWYEKHMNPTYRSSDYGDSYKLMLDDRYSTVVSMSSCQMVVTNFKVYEYGDEYPHHN